MEWVLEVSSERGGEELIGMAVDGDPAIDEWKEERNDARIAEDAVAGENNGVDSEAGGFVMAVLASRLHTGQNVLQEVSHASTQNAWNL